MREVAIEEGIYPINDALIPFMYDDSKIMILRGGRGGGKSNTVALRLINEAINEKYMTCYYGRKILDRVRGSQHQELIKAIKQLRKEDQFSFSEQPNGSLTITHHENGNKLMPFGADNAASMKSISDPTHIWADEFDQFTDYDFRALFPTLRTIRGKNIFIGSFNSYEVLKDHWIVKYFYPEYYDGIEKYDYDVLKNVSISKYLVNYFDNFFIDKEEYENQLRISAGGDADLFEGLAHGEWGLDKKGNEWYHGFKTGLHVDNIEYIPGLPIHLTYDFNLLPYMTLLCAQIRDGVDEMQIRFFKEYCFKPPLNTTEDVTSQFLVDHFGQITDLFYYGDAMGTRGVEGFGNQFTRFDPVREVLRNHLGHASDRTTRYNIGVNKRRDLINQILSGNMMLGNKKVTIVIDKSCTELKKDMQLLKIGIDGKLKEKGKDPVTGAVYEKLGHCSDSLDYLVCTIFENYIK